MAETKIVVSSTTIPLMGKSTNSAANAVNHSIITNQSIVGGLMDEIAYGMADKAKRVYLYARDHYILGLPECSIYGAEQVPDNDIKGIIEGIVGQSVTIDYAIIDRVDGRIVVLPYLTSVRGYNIKTNIVANPPSGYSFEYEENPVTISKVTVNGSSVTIEYRQQYIGSESGSDMYRYAWETVSVDPSIALGGTYCIVHYFLGDGSDHYWFYNLADGTYPDIVASANGFGVNAFMPVVPLRHNNIDLTTIDDDLHRTSKSLLKKMNIKIEDLAESINSNPDIGSIDHAYVIFGVEANTDDVAGLRYLTEYFDYLYGLQQYSILDWETSILNGQYPSQTSVKLNIYWGANNPFWGYQPDAAILEHGLNIELFWDYISSEIITGSIGKKYHATVSVEHGTEEIPTPEPVGDQDPTTIISTTKLIYRYQFSQDQYKEVKVCNLVHYNFIYAEKAVITNIDDIYGDDDSIKMVIPIHYGIAAQLKIFHQNDLFNNSLFLVINCYEKIKLKWYQTTVFKIIVQIVGIVITVATYGGAATGWQALVALLQYVGTAVVVSYAFKFLSRELGQEWAAVIGAALVVVSAFSSGWLKLDISFSLPTAQILLESALSVLWLVNQFFKYAIGEVTNELTNFQAEADEQQKKLEAAQDLLKTTDMAFDPMSLLDAPVQPFVPAESPDAFFNRTVHSGNIGIASIDVIGIYVDLMLKLPEPDYR